MVTGNTDDERTDKKNTLVCWGDRVARKQEENERRAHYRDDKRKVAIGTDRRSSGGPAGHRRLLRVLLERCDVSEGRQPRSFATRLEA